MIYVLVQADSGLRLHLHITRTAAGFTNLVRYGLCKMS